MSDELLRECRDSLIGLLGLTAEDDLDVEATAHKLIPRIDAHLARNAGFVSVPREVLEAVLAHYSEFENDLDETGCPTGWVECPVCEQGGSHDGRHKRPIQHETDGCPNKVIRELLAAAGDGK